MRFIGRIEYFGSLIYDTQRREYIPIDQDGTNIILNIKPNIDIDNLYYKYFSHRFSYLNFKSFIQLIQSIEIIDNNYSSNVEILSNENLEFYLNNRFISSPLKFHIALTYECLLKCKHCFSKSGKKTNEELNQELSTQKILDFLDELKNNGIFYVSFGGGEPFLKKEFIEILKKADQNKMNISISTSLIFPDIEKFLQENINIQEFKISIEAVNAKEYNNIRGKNIFETLKKNLLLINEYKKYNKCYVRFSFVLNKYNYTYLPNFLSFAEQFNANGITFYPIYNVGRAEEYPELLLSNQEIEKIVRIISNMKERTKIDVEFFGIPMKFGKNGLYESFGCGCAKTTAYLSALGDILPSGMFLKYKDKFSLGNIKEKTLKEIWKENAKKEINKIDQDIKCQNCTYITECRGGCIFRSFDKYQKLGYKDPICNIQ
ncbi:MAG: radical SAM protein [Candidatus Calescibacterium sp.]|nr:radical SAM protein [Candidatus Calescibacterium sp.]MDW8132511.1 radical SAM protein [Candidatus Calescibacterium sp.]